VSREYGRTVHVLTVPMVPVRTYQYSYVPSLDVMGRLMVLQIPQIEMSKRKKSPMDAPHCQFIRSSFEFEGWLTHSPLTNAYDENVLC
jgi:hypothetical protein